MSVRELKADARLSPIECLKAVVADIESGKRQAERVIVVVEDTTNGALDVRAAGPGLSYVPTVMGLLHVAIGHLQTLVMG